ncbi:MAG TPA: hemerythrin domain-containing protein [Bacillales bacterium]|nr:hemerythrin domain-containing protein [Bacillales bacterium]
MSGPALVKKDSHHAIHEAALNEASELTDLLKRMVKGSADSTNIIETAYILVEHWETRTLAHATAEEEGLYLQKVEEFPELTEKVNELKKEHDLLRQFIHEIKDLLPKSGVNTEVLSRFDKLLTVDEIHNDKEENELLEYGR